MASLNGFDWFLVALLGVSTVAAFQRGIIRVLFSLSGLIVGILMASWNYEALATYLHPWITWRETAEVVAFLLILVGVMIVAGLLAKVMRRTVDAVGLGIVDRLLGAGFGFVRGCLAGVVVMMGIAAFVPESTWVKNSQLAPYFLGGAHAVSFVVPDHFQQQVAEGATRILHVAPEMMKPHTLEWNHSD